MNTREDDEWGEVTNELSTYVSAAPHAADDEPTRPVDVEWSVAEDGTIAVTCSTKRAATR